MSGHHPFNVLRARLTEDQLRWAYIRGAISKQTADDAMVRGKFRWDPEIYPNWVIRDCYWKADE